ncbi:MAG: polysaccharide deacetylase family protein [Myxococcota bacterium]
MARGALLALALIALAARARAESAELVVLFDLDRDPGSGCTYETSEGSVHGIERLVRTIVDLDANQVSSATHAACENPVTHAFGAEVAVSGFATSPWDVVPGDGTSGSTLIESYLPLSAVPGASVVHAYVALSGTAGGDALLSTTGAGGGEAIALALGTTPVPALASWTLATLALLLVGVALAAGGGLRSRRARALGVIAALALPSWARAGLGDGALRTWEAFERVALDPRDDAPEGSDILAAFAHVDEAQGVLVLRVDALLGPALCLAWPSVDPGSGYPCSQEPPPDPGPFENRVALTFDDGPNLDSTPSIVATLRAESVPATFFMLGLRLESAAARALALEIHDDPLFEIANHSYTHPFFTSLSDAQMRTEISTTNDALRLALGDPCFFPRFFRIPFSASNCAAAGVVREHGLSMVGMHADSLDWCYAAGNGFCSPALVSGLANEFRNDMVAWLQFKVQQTDGGIVLLHDIHANTAAQLPALIAALRADGATFVRLDDASVFPLVNAAVNPPEAPACCELAPP